MDRIRAWLDDILVAIDEIEQDLPPVRDFKLYRKNRTAKRAIERNLEIIGEAMSRVLKTDVGIEVPSARKIVNLRNQIIHGYDNLSDEIIYTIATRDVPQLKKDIRKLIE